MSRLWFWAFSDDAERWAGPFETKELAVADAMTDPDAEEFTHVYIAPGEPTDPSEAIDADHIFDQWGDNNPECSPLDESWPMLWGTDRTQMDDLTARLRAAFKEWASDHKVRTWYTVDPMGEGASRLALEAQEQVPA